MIKAGGNVVKNVAGYDLGKLVSGSHGSLAAIVSATFKLMPLPAASNTLVATFASADALVAALAAITGSQLEASAIDVRAGLGQPRLLLKFESTPGALNAHVEKARALLAGATCDVVSASAEPDLWRAITRAPCGSRPVSSSRLACCWRRLCRARDSWRDARDCRGSGARWPCRARIGTASHRRRPRGAASRRRSDAGQRWCGRSGHVVLLRAPTELKQQIDVWGSLGDASGARRVGVARSIPTAS